MRDIRDEARELADANGGLWGEHPAWPAADWRYEVESGDTRLGYQAWLEAKRSE